VDLSEFRSLFTSQGQEALQAAQALAPREIDFLSHFTQLRRRFPAGVARAVLETTILRTEASKKFPFAHKMYFIRPALEQATAYEVAEYRAARYRPFRRVWDLGCSIGGDTLALAQVVQEAAGVDLDRLRLEMARANLAALGLGDKAAFIQADLSVPLPCQGSPDTGLFFDPARRVEGRRIFSVSCYHPPLETIQAWLPSFPALGVKISPGVSLEEISGYPAEIEFISLMGELKEAVLWFGPLKTAYRRATVLPGPHSLISEGPVEVRLPLSEPQAYLYEPAPSILRAGLVAPLGESLGAFQLDPDIGYLTASTQQETPFARSWQVLDWMPFNLKRLRAYLREQQVGVLTVKKRGSPLEPEALIKDLRLKGDQERVIFLTQLQGRPVVVVCSA
jgi:hypothetical protein